MQLTKGMNDRKKDLHPQPRNWSYNDVLEFWIQKDFQKEKIPFSLCLTNNNKYPMFYEAINIDKKT